MGTRLEPLLLHQKKRCGVEARSGWCHRHSNRHWAKTMVHKIRQWFVRSFHNLRAIGDERSNWTSAGKGWRALISRALQNSSGFCEQQL